MVRFARSPTGRSKNGARPLCRAFATTGPWSGPMNGSEATGSFSTSPIGTKRDLPTPPVRYENRATHQNLGGDPPVQQQPRQQHHRRGQEEQPLLLQSPFKRLLVASADFEYHLWNAASLSMACFASSSTAMTRAAFMLMFLMS